MNFQRIYHTFNLYLRLSGPKRGMYIRKHNIMRHVGENVDFMPRKIPLYPNLISIGNNVMIASGVSFLTHDSIHRICNTVSDEMSPQMQHNFKENIGCIKIDDNVFIGANSMISANVYIGKNVVVTAGSVVVKDIPNGSIVRGNPAKVICKFDDFYRIRMAKEAFPDIFSLIPGSKVSLELTEWMWKQFERRH